MNALEPGGSPEATLDSAAPGTGGITDPGKLDLRFEEVKQSQTGWVPQGTAAQVVVRAWADVTATRQIYDVTVSGTVTVRSSNGQHIATKSFDLGVDVAGSFTVTVPYVGMGVKDSVRVTLEGNAGYTYIFDGEDVPGSASKTIGTYAEVREDHAPPVVVFDAVPSPDAAPLPGKTVPFRLAGSITDPLSGVASLRWGFARGDENAATVNGESWSLEGQLLGVVGENVVKLQATDAAGNTVDHERTIVLADKTPPELSITPPGRLVQDLGPVSFALTGWTRDAHGPVASVAVEVVKGGTVVASASAARQGENWTAQVAGLSQGAHEARVVARDTPGNSRTETLAFTVFPVEPPRIEIESPTANQVVVAEGGASPQVLVTGNVEVNDTTLTAVRVYREGGESYPVELSPGQRSLPFSVLVSLPPTGIHELVVHATSAAANPAVREATRRVRVSVGTPYSTHSTEDSTTLPLYLADLLDYAGRRVQVRGNGPDRALAAEELEREFFQPFRRLRELSGDPPVTHVRLAVEVLRGYAARGGLTLSPAAESAYRQAAYHALLVQMGTSYGELRRLRPVTVPGPEQARRDRERQALADRLGFGTQVEMLETIFLDPGTVTEDQLAQVFRLPPTTVPLPLTPAARLLDARLQHLRATWLRDDHAGGAVLPLLDPDLVTEESFLPAARVPTNPAYRTWSERRAWAAARATHFATRVNGESEAARLSRLVAEATGTATAAGLAQLQARRAAGEEVSAELAALGLTPASLEFLAHAHATAAQATLLESEWAEIASLMVHLAKVPLRAAWRAQEAGVAVGPDLFQPLAVMPAFDPWRVDAAAWRERQLRVQARADQARTVERAYDDAVAAAEAAALPLLRDALVALHAATPTPTAGELEQVADWLTQRLMIDVRATGSLRTTRKAQAVETLQGIVGTVRTGRFMEMAETGGRQTPPGEWVIALQTGAGETVESAFDAEWAWMGTYSGWAAAMRVFLYPENVLLPATGRTVTPAFTAMLRARPSGPMSTAAAAEMAGVYLDALSDGVLAWLDGAVAGWAARARVLEPALSEAALRLRADTIRQVMQAPGATGSAYRPYLEELFFWAPVQLALLLHQAGQHGAALDWLRTVYGYNLPPEHRKVYWGLVEEESRVDEYVMVDAWLRQKLNPHALLETRPGALTRFTLAAVARCFLDMADDEFAAENGESAARARTLYLSALELLGSAHMQVDGEEPAAKNGFAPNPEPRALRGRAELNLYKLRTGRNIAGMQRRGPGYAAGHARLGAPQPTPYRYGFLVERARQLVGVAQQVEAQYLASLEKRDAETYTLLKARQDLGIAGATVQLQNLRVSQATDGIRLATLQRGRAQVQRDRYREWIAAGPSAAERDLARTYTEMHETRSWAAGLQAATTVAQAALNAGSGGFLGTGAGAHWTAVGAIGALAIAQAEASRDLSALETRAQLTSLRASYERREQEWELQAALAEKDEAIGQQQEVQAMHQVSIARQERVIAGMQAGNAAATLEFLATKFTSAELYEWMSGVLGRVYAYFLQQATAVARLAEAQLAFERQEESLSLIRMDYWQATADDGGDPARDRRGLTGSARLLQDVYQLDQYAFETARRKLHLTRTISLAEEAPYELEQFRRTGTLLFATPMELFDRDFPGHYLRLVRQVRTSVVALVPPAQGIRATLSASGLSRVTVPDDGFQPVVVRRDPERVALTSPAGATGVFELDTQSELMLPFEGMGVDTTWELEMPRASNPFDYGSIADVILTVEYTALHSDEHRQQVIRSLPSQVSGERGISFADHFPDQWYALSNGATEVDFEIRRGMFPPHLEELRVESLVVLFPSEGEAPMPAGVARLAYPVLDASGNPGRGEGEPAQAFDGVLSTRRGAWPSVIGARPVAGTWTLAVDGPTGARLRAGEVRDLVLVLGYAGRTPEWPQH